MQLFTRSRHAFLFICLSLIILCLLIFIAVTFRLPAMSEQFIRPDTTAEIAVNRMENGIPVISSGDITDAYWGLGVVHAQDRAWQLVLFRRIVQGRQAEIFGDEKLEQDKLARILDFYRLVESDYKQLPVHARTVLDAYSAGINYWMRQGNLPPEFSAFDITPDDWRPLDSLAILKLHAFATGDDFRTELFDIWVNQKRHSAVEFPLTDSSFADLPYRESYSSVDQHTSGERAKVLLGQYFGGLVLPSKYYVAYLDSQGYQLSGLTLPGVPLFLSGFNQRLAWSVVSQPAKSKQLSLSGYDQLAVSHAREHLISVRKNPPSLFDRQAVSEPQAFQTVLYKEGIDISAVVGFVGEAVILNWTGFEPDRSFAGLLDMNLASDWFQFKRAARLVSVLAGEVFVSSETGEMHRLYIGQDVAGNYQGNYQGQPLINVDTHNKKVGVPDKYHQTDASKVDGNNMDSHQLNMGVLDKSGAKGMNSQRLVTKPDSMIEARDPLMGKVLDKLKALVPEIKESSVSLNRLADEWVSSLLYGRPFSELDGKQQALTYWIKVNQSRWLLDNLAKQTTCDLSVVDEVASSCRSKMASLIQQVNTSSGNKQKSIQSRQTILEHSVFDSQSWPGSFFSIELNDDLSENNSFTGRSLSHADFVMYLDEELAGEFTLINGESANVFSPFYSNQKNVSAVTPDVLQWAEIPGSRH